MMSEPNYNEPFPFTLRLSSEKLGKYMDMHDMVMMMAESHALFDKTFGVLSGQRRLSSQKRKDFQVIVKDMKQGSLLLYADIVVSGINVALPIIGLANPYTVWEYTRAGFQLLKALYTVSTANASQQPEYPRISTGENGMVIVVSGNNNTMTFPAPVLDIAARSRINYRRISNMMSSDGITQLQLNSESLPNSEPITLSVADQGLFEPTTFLEPSPVTFIADLYKFDKETSTGRLHVIASDVLLKGDYAFSVIGNQDLALYIDSMKESQVSLTALTENTLDPIHGRRIVRLQVISVNFP